ncbi:MAG TPA: pitrilysin family protein [Pseudomonadales bacterium]|nr:pitrilysin family protein [Pseudomonadales bacterium]
MSRQFFHIGALVLTLASPLSEAAAPTQEKTLANGLKVVVQEDHRAPVVVSQVWYRVGSSYENVGHTGISHVLEHMMFKGTPKLGPGEFSKLIAAQGGEENAFTTSDYTAYYQVIGANKLPLCFELEADRMQNLLVDDAEFKKEIRVVMEERRWRTEDNPEAKTYERFLASAFISHPDHNPVIGWMNDLEHLDSTHVRDWYKTWYKPNNAVVVVVGDVQTEQVFQLAERFFGPVAAGNVPTLPVPKEVEPLGERRLTVKVPAKLPALLMGFNVPTLTSADNKQEVYALRMLAGILDGGESARFATQLVRAQQVAAGINTGYSGFDRGDALFMISAVPTQKHSMDELEKAIWQQIEKIKNDPISADELQRVKAQIISSDVYKQDDIQHRAMQIGTLEALGLGWRAQDEYTTALQNISVEQIKAVAKKYLTHDRLTVARLDPQPLSGKEPRSFVPTGPIR